MKFSRKINIPLYPTKQQEQILLDYTRQTKQIWNTTLSYWRWLHDQNKLNNEKRLFKKEVENVYKWWVKQFFYGKTIWEIFSEVQTSKNKYVLPAVARNHIIGTNSSNPGQIWLAYEAFLKGIRRPPQYKSVRCNSPELLLIPQNSAFHINDVNGKWAEISLAGVGRVKIRYTSRFRSWLLIQQNGEATFGKGTVTHKNGRWVLSLTFSTKQNIFLKKNRRFPQKEVGIDLGASIPAALSNGKILGVTKPSLDPINANNPWNKDKKDSSWETLQKKIKILVKRLSKLRHRRIEEAKQIVGINKNVLLPQDWHQIKQYLRRPSKQEQKLKERKQNLERKLNNKKIEFRHQISHKIASEAKNIYIEDLKLSKMSKSAKGTKQQPGKNVKAKSGLNRVLLENGLADICEKVKYKSQDYGGTVILVDPANTSQTCPQCGYCSNKSLPKNLRNRKSQSVFQCCACGYKENADIVGAKNVLVKGKAPNSWEKKRMKGTKTGLQKMKHLVS